MQVIERVAEHYDTQEVDFGRIYRWCPEWVVVECKCGKRKTLTRTDLIKAKPACECGTDNTASVREEVVLELLDKEYEVHHHQGRPPSRTTKRDYQKALGLSPSPRGAARF
jgi:hypothetical protein